MTITVEPPPAELEPPPQCAGEPPPVPAADVIEEARARQRRERRTAAGLILAAAVAGVVALALGGNGSKAAGSSQAQARVPVGSRTPTRGRTACVWRATLPGRPGRSLVSILGVLRRPATAADSAPSSVFIGPYAFLGAELYTRDIRRARGADGAGIYLVPVHYDGCGPVRAYGPAPTGDGVFFKSSTLGGGFGGSTAQIEDAEAWGTGGPGIASLPGGLSATVALVVPDAVATVDVRYPAGPPTGLRRGLRLPAVTVVAHPVGNVVVYDVPRGAGGRAIRPLTMIWRDAAGRTLRTFHSL